MQWPPSLRWTFKQSVDTDLHFAAIKHGIDRNLKWVNLVFVLNGELCFTVDFAELKASKLWIPEWVEPRNNRFLLENNFDIRKLDLGIKKLSKASLHASKDSGLTIPCLGNSFRN